MSREMDAGPDRSETVRTLRASELRGAYEEAWREWEAAGEDRAWDAVTADGLWS